jgi:hypothetical protein
LLLLLVVSSMRCRYGGGRADLSDTMAGTLSVAGTLFILAATNNAAAAAAAAAATGMFFAMQVWWWPC